MNSNWKYLVDEEVRKWMGIPSDQPCEKFGYIAKDLKNGDVEVFPHYSLSIGLTEFLDSFIIHIR